VLVAVDHQGDRAAEIDLSQQHGNQTPVGKLIGHGQPRDDTSTHTGLHESGNGRVIVASGDDVKCDVVRAQQLGDQRAAP
jgi:hypothetical protein